jgi:phage terminase large subunit
MSAFRHDASTHDKAAVRDFKRIMMEKYPEIWKQGKWNNQLKTFTFDNGSILEFVGTNDPGKLHGPERDIAFLNEVMEITYEAYRQILSRTRLLVVMDWNPSLNVHWVFDRVMKREDVLYVHSTYKDNPHLSAKQIVEIEATNPKNPENLRNGTADQWYWDVYGLGKRGRREGAIFSIYEVIDYWPEKHLCDKWGYGLDFGYSDDPAALIECCIHQGALLLRERVYETKLITIKSHAAPNTPSLQGRFEEMGISKNSKIKADQSRPDQIAELKTEGYNISATPKGKGSVVAGIDLIKRFPIRVHRASTNLQMEFQQYAWKKHSTGLNLNEPEDKWNHGIDAARYWALDELVKWQPARPGMRKGLARAQGKPRKRY